MARKATKEGLTRRISAVRRSIIRLEAELKSLDVKNAEKVKVKS